MGLWSGFPVFSDGGQDALTEGSARFPDSISRDQVRRGYAEDRGDALELVNPDLLIAAEPVSDPSMGNAKPPSQFGLVHPAAT